ncbi:MAG: DUF2577 family protein [Fusobacterium sp.]|jgi:uncharacterized protein YlzI (FlbEa/FlbD family)|uniref:DUF2577 family protein n=1 Tax=Fusobacterium sp. TaxID=68766 RepID=UPI0015A67DFB|nr:DUF2577 family protein [Fusobacterium sp.]MEE1477127.1 DUF2577 family protein [Fusobacterium sp.]DAN86483.1 MAG TPA: Protein of unknown function (DUF2577) [Caudoviricetes sp.]
MKKEQEYHNSINTLAKLIKARDNPKWLGAVTGEVIKAPPQLEVKLQNGIVIKNHKIMISIEKIIGYKREFSLDGTINDITINATTSNKPCGLGASNAHGTIQGKGNYKTVGTITWTDTLKVGDTVLMLPTNKEEYFYLIDRVVRL